jgi:hypothetical protein
MLPPTIPTSFVPHTAVGEARRARADYGGLFGTLAYILFGVAVILAVGVFLYGRVLSGTQAAKDAALATAVKGIDSATVEGFVRLRDRLASGQTLLDGHVAFTGFFSSLEKILPASVRFTSIHLSAGDTGAPKLEGSGVAKSFNALAAASAALAADGRIKGAIFSNISISRDSSVSFVLSATLDPKLVAFTP